MNNIDKLGHLLQQRMKGQAGALQSVVVEFGILMDDLSLSVTGLQNSIPNGDYMVCRHLNLGGGSLEKGDRVLVLWCGAQPIIVDAIVGS